MREMRAALAKTRRRQTAPVMAVIGAGAGEDRSIVALNIALAAARDGAKVLMIDADSWNARAVGQGQPTRPRASPAVSAGSASAAKASRAIETANGISILPAVQSADARVRDVKASDAIRKRDRAGPLHRRLRPRHSRRAGDAMERRPTANCSTSPTVSSRSSRSISIINDSMEDIIAALGGAERKLVGVILNELNPTVVNRQRDKQYA